MPPTIEAAAAAVGLSPEPALDPLNPYDDPTGTPQHQVHVVRVMEEQLAALVPSLEGDEAAGHVAILRTLPVQVGDGVVGGGSWWMGTGPCSTHQGPRVWLSWCAILFTRNRNVSF